MNLEDFSPRWRPLAQKILETEQRLIYSEKRDELIAELAKRPEIRAQLRRKAGLPPLAR